VTKEEENDIIGGIAYSVTWLWTEPFVAGAGAERRCGDRMRMRESSRPGAVPPGIVGDAGEHSPARGER
jgi:hypothetical protein